jgi:hypothetical protein
MPAYPNQGRLFAPVAQPSRGTVTAQAISRRPPVWLVAVASGVAALMVAGLVFVLLTQLVFTPPNHRKTAKSTAGSSSATPSVAAGPPSSAGGSASGPSSSNPAAASLPAPAGTGPFQSARAAFLASLASATPASMMAPDTNPAVAAPGDSATAAPPSATAAAAVVPAVAAPDAVPAPVAPAVQPPASSPAPPVGGPPAARASLTQTAPQPQPWPRRGASAAASDSQAEGLLTIVCLPSCDQILDNGRSLGKGPIFKQSVSVGPHRITLKSGSMTKVISKVVIVDQLTAVRESMTP